MTSRPDEVYRGVTRVFSVVILAFGIVIVVRTLAAGGGPLSAGFLVGLLFAGIGAGRLYIAFRQDG